MVIHIHYQSTEWAVNCHKRLVMCIININMRNEVPVFVSCLDHTSVAYNCIIVFKGRFQVYMDQFWLYLFMYQ